VFLNIYIVINIYIYIYIYIGPSLIFVMARRREYIVGLGSVCGPILGFCVFCFYKSLGLL
jgi:hypothetical protein